MKVDTDCRGQLIAEIGLGGIFFRATYIEHGWAGSPALRLQIRDGDGRVLPGPEIPVAFIGEVFNAMAKTLVVGFADGSRGE